MARSPRPIPVKEGTVRLCARLRGRARAFCVFARVCVCVLVEKDKFSLLSADFPLGIFYHQYIDSRLSRCSVDTDNFYIA